ncbi:DUF692 family multinuclear iron-containing protein [Pseudomonas sp. zbq_18]|uniref:MNIO family bufferin maturase n=1 Tax=Pseudomonadota TaxID=1224 RepID=UPI00370CCC27
MSSRALRGGAGVGFKPVHFEALLANPGRFDFIEIHAENYFGEGGLLHAQLGELRRHLPLSIHGVGLSLGGVDPLDVGHLRRLQRLCERYAPTLVSEHLAWSGHAGQYLGDLLPLAYTETTLNRVASRVQQVQEVLGRPILVENPAVYLRLEGSEMSEVEFLRQLCRITGCGLLLDLNNLLVSCHNCGASPGSYLAALPVERVGELHLAGHSRVQGGGLELLVDDHASAVSDATWDLYVQWLVLAGPRPCLIEWDRELPAWGVLAAEVDCARALQHSPYMPPFTHQGSVA